MLRKDRFTKETGFLNISCQVEISLVPTVHGLGLWVLEGLFLISMVDPRRPFPVNQCHGHPCASVLARSLHRTTSAVAPVMTRGCASQGTACQ